MIPLVVALWEHTNFGGRKRLIVDDTPSLGAQGFNDVTSAVGVHPGPDYAAWKAANGGKEPTVGLYVDADFNGAALILTTGAYPSIFGDTVSSVRFNPPPPQPAAAIAPIPLIVELFQHASFAGNRIVIVENSASLSNDFGGNLNDAVSSARVKEGPNFVAGKQAQLFRDANFAGGKIDLAPGNYPNLGVSHGFNDVVSSIRVR